MVSLDEAVVERTWIFRPKKRTGSSVNGMGTPLRWSGGSLSSPVEACKDIHCQLGTLAAIPDHRSESDTRNSRYWQAAGELATRHVIRILANYCEMT